MVRISIPGTREPQVYGQTSLAEIDHELRQRAMVAKHELETFQSNHEGALVDCIQQRGTQAALLIINPGPTRIPALLSVMQFWRWVCQ